MNRWLTILLAASALTIAGCNKDKAATTESSVEASTTESLHAGEDHSVADKTTADENSATNEATPEATAAPDAAPTPTADNAPATAATSGEVTLPGGTKYVDTQVGDGAEAKPGSKVSVHYTGTLEDGTKFDSSLDRGEPFSFTLGENHVIQGWEKGIVGMKVGGHRKLIIPPAEGYGARNMGPIPPNSTLLFDVELVDVK